MRFLPFVSRQEERPQLEKGRLKGELPLSRGGVGAEFSQAEVGIS